MQCTSALASDVKCFKGRCAVQLFGWAEIHLEKVNKLTRSPAPGMASGAATTKIAGKPYFDLLINPKRNLILRTSL